MDEALGLSCGAGGVEDEEGVFGVHVLRGADGVGGGHEFVPPEVSALLHVDG